MCILAKIFGKNNCNNLYLKAVTFPATTTRFLKLSADRMVKDGEQIGIAELGVK